MLMKDAYMRISLTEEALEKALTTQGFNEISDRELARESVYVVFGHPHSLDTLKKEMEYTAYQLEKRFEEVLKHICAHIDSPGHYEGYKAGKVKSFSDYLKNARERILEEQNRRENWMQDDDKTFEEFDYPDDVRNIIDESYSIGDVAYTFINRKLRRVRLSGATPELYEVQKLEAIEYRPSDSGTGYKINADYRDAEFGELARVKKARVFPSMEKALNDLQKSH